MIRLFSATLLSLLLCASLAYAAEKPLIVASDATWPPIEMLDENKNVVGYSIDYLKAVAKEAGLNVEFHNTAWDGIFAALESRQADIIASSVTITEKRKKAMGFSDPYCEIRQAVVVPVGVDIKTLKELDPWSMRRSGYVSVKESVFPFRRFPGVDILLGPEMRSTGEVMVPHPERDPGPCHQNEFPGTAPCLQRLRL